VEWCDLVVESEGTKVQKERKGSGRVTGGVKVETEMAMDGK
jgi:hypothetical protein